MPNVLVSGVGFDAILAANDAMALGAIEALEAAGKPLVPVVGVNAVPDAIAAMTFGKLLATASFDAMKMACLAAETAVRYLNGETVQRGICRLKRGLYRRRIRLSKKLDATVGWR